MSRLALTVFNLRLLQWILLMMDPLLLNQSDTMKRIFPEDIGKGERVEAAGGGICQVICQKTHVSFTGDHAPEG